MSSIKATARFAGLLYVLFSILAVLTYLVVFPSFMVPGDATETVRRITEGALMYRVGILMSLVGHVLFLFTALALYQLFKDVDRWQARLMVVLVCVGVTADIVVVANRLAPLMLSSGDGFLSEFSKPQLDALALGSIRWGNHLARLQTAFWGLWLFPFGILTIRSGFFPRILGILLFVSGAAYVVTCVTFVVFPAQLSAVSRIMTPLYFGELAMVLWLAIMGAKEPAAEAQTRAG